ncbi:hypothetical protein BC941DRAFT_472309 [Chlamydoabsidia padenii]|nr:hypothetical protein BC941DRAFT_472309 [Chlamydoabsidia padenii]
MPYTILNLLSFYNPLVASLDIAFISRQHSAYRAPLSQGRRSNRGRRVDETCTILRITINRQEFNKLTDRTKQLDRQNEYRQYHGSLPLKYETLNNVIIFTLSNSHSMMVTLSVIQRLPSLLVGKHTISLPDDVVNSMSTHLAEVMIIDIDYASY